MVCYDDGNMEPMDCLWNGDAGALVEHLSQLGYRMEELGDRTGPWDSKLYQVPQQAGPCRHSEIQGDVEVRVLIRQANPGRIILHCGWCEEQSCIEIPYRLTGLSARYSDYPPGSVQLGFVGDWRLIQLFKMAGFSCRTGPIHERVVNNYDHFVVEAACGEHDMVVRYMNSDVRQIDCAVCGPETAAENFIERFAIGLRMAEKLNPRLIERAA